MPHNQPAKVQYFFGMCKLFEWKNGKMCTVLSTVLSIVLSTILSTVLSTIGVKGYLVTSLQNVNSIFLPAPYPGAGERDYQYWSSSLYDKVDGKDPFYAYRFYFFVERKNTNSISCRYSLLFVCLRIRFLPLNRLG